MILKVYHEQGLAIAEILIKEANLAQSDALKAEMIGIIDQKPRKVLVDFALVEYVDSSFLGAMVSSLKYAVANQTDIAVMNLAKDIEDLFALIRLDKVFKIYPDKATALTDIK
jgi:anti-sigma B factor antagonist